VAKKQYLAVPGMALPMKTGKKSLHAIRKMSKLLSKFLPEKLMLQLQDD
jgi:hypothetical protein